MRLAVLTLFLAILSAAPSVEFYVSPTGSPGNDGSKAAPFATIGEGQAAIRNAREANPSEGATLWFADGVYPLNTSVVLGAEDSGVSEKPVHYRAVNPGEARISGGRALSPTDFVSAAENTRLPEGARSSVVQLDLKAQGIDALGAFPDQYRTALPVPELFFNGARMTLAQWPNEGWAEIDTVVESGPAPWRNHESDALGIFTYSGDEPARWSGVEEIWLEGYWCFDWASETIRVKSVDTTTHQIALAKTHVYGLGSGNPAPRRFRAVNLLEELDMAGEYFIDRESGTLYFWPPASMENAKISLSLLAEPLFTLTEVNDFTMSGLVFEDCAGTALTVTGGRSVTLAGCTIRNAGLQGIVVDGGTAHTIESCDIHHNGTGGIQIAGGDRKTLTPSEHRVVNNYIHHVSERMRTAAYNLRVDGVGIYVAHNEISDAPHQAIGWAGNDHIFEFNDVHHVSMNSDDCGAFYTGRNPSNRGSIIRHNYWHEIGSAMAHGSCAIYFDDGDGGQTVEGNVFYKASGGSFGAVFNHGGHDNVVKNNIFVDCSQAIASAPWSDANWQKWLKEPIWQTRLLEEVDITKAPFTEHYPALKGFFEYEGLRMNYASTNVVVGCKNYVEGNWIVGDSLVTMEDPGFVDRAGKDFTLRDDAAVFTLLPDFVPIPFGKIGRYPDAYRVAGK